MIIYLFTFLIVTMLSILIQLIMKNNKKAAFLLSFLCIIILSLVAGLRANSVGRDINVYGLSTFNNCRKFNSILSYIKFYQFKEPLYYGLNYIVFKLFGNFNVFLFILQFILSSFVFKIAYDESKEDKGTFWLYIFAYLIFWYNTSFNIIRQSLAIIILVYAFRFLLKEKYKKYYLYVFFAFLFHSSSIICIFLPLLKKISTSKKRVIYLVIVPTLLFCLFITIDSLTVLLSHYFPFFSKYYEYVKMDQTNLIVKFAILKFLVAVVLLFFATGNRFRENKENLIFSFIIIIDFLLYISSNYIMFGYRLSYFFLPLFIYLIPRLDKSYSDVYAKRFYRIAIICTMIFYWYYRYIAIGYDGTIPYMFFWE